MKLQLMSLNVGGLNDLHKVDQLKSYINSIQPQIDIIMLPEHKLRSQKALELGRLLNSSPTYFFCEVELGYNNNDPSIGAGCGGTAILIQHKWSSLITSSSSLFRGKVTWFILKV